MSKQAKPNAGFPPSPYATPTESLEKLLHPGSRAHLGDPEGVLSEAALRVHQGCAALRALAALTAGERASVSDAQLSELRREDMGALLDVLEQHFSSALHSLDTALSPHH